MPLYEYKCKKCGNSFEELVFGEEKVKCPKCGSEEVEKLLSVFSSGGGESKTTTSSSTSCTSFS